MRGREKVKMSPIVQHILRFATSEERGGIASLPQLLDSLYANSGTGSPEPFLTVIEKGLRTCWKLGYLYLDRVVDGTRRSVVVPEWKTLALGDVVSWDAERDRWQVRQDQQGIVVSWKAGYDECEMSWKQHVVQDVLVQLTRGGVRALALYEKQHLGTGQ